MRDSVSAFPNHVAIIMDGNGRWATNKGRPRIDGHRFGYKAIHDITRYLGETGKVNYATFFAFSTENWSRPQAEIKGIFSLLGKTINNEASELHKANIRICWMGRSDKLPKSLVGAINNAVELTANNSGMTVSIAFNYGGRQEIADAVQKIVRAGISPDSINENTISQYLYAPDIPNVDLLIRTADEQRISNFLLWQTAYSEFYFTPVLWPDFSREEMDKALLTYSMRKRRFGGL